MAEQQTLLSILQFVALVAPAIAILMQYFQGNSQVDDDVFRLLEGALTLIVLGGMIVAYKLLSSINDSVVALGSVLVFSSMLLIAISLWWRHIPLTLDLSATSRENALRSAMRVLRVAGIFIIPLMIFTVAYYPTTGFVVEHISYGPATETGFGSASHLYQLAAILLLLRTYLVLGRTEYFSEKPLQESVTKATAISLGIIFGFAVFVIPVFSIFTFISFVLTPILDSGPFHIFQKSHPIFWLPYVWAGIAIIAIYAAEIDEESENTSADSESTQTKLDT